MDLVGCIVCGVAIDHFLYSLRYGPIISQKKKWERHKRRPGFLFLSAEELEKHYFQKGCCHWQGLCRLILYDHAKKKHCLSGVGQIIRVASPDGGFDGGYVAPRDPEKAVMGEPAKDDVRLTKVHTERYMGWWNTYSWGWFDWRDLPLGVHMSCWKVAQSILGPSIEDNLELFVVIALQNAREPLKPYNHMPLSADDFRGPWVNLYPETSDPYRTPAVKKAIARSKKSKKPRFTYPHDSFSGLLKLPAELLYRQVLDLLTCKELSRLEIAMQIAIPDSYWRERAAEYLVEMDKITGDENNINWRYLSKAMEALKKVNGRRHVVDILRGIKPGYLQNLDKRVVPRLEDLMYQIQDEVNQYFRGCEKLETMLREEPSIAEWIKYRQRRGMKPC